jgi:hypothetical protein
MRTPIRPYDEALAAIDAYERNPYKFVREEDAHFLRRLRGIECRTKVADAWSLIRKYLCKPGDDIRVIECAVAGFRVAKALPKVPGEIKQLERDLAEAQKAVRTLRKYFEGYQDEEGYEGERLKRELAWAEDVLRHEALDFQVGWYSGAHSTVLLNTAGTPPRLSRKKVRAERITFMGQLASQLRTLLGRPCYEAVATFTDVAFETEKGTDPEQVRKATKRTIGRKLFRE